MTDNITYITLTFMVATSRIYRQGSDSTVYIYHLISENSIEGYIQQVDREICRQYYYIKVLVQQKDYKKKLYGTLETVEDEKSTLKGLYKTEFSRIVYSNYRSTDQKSLYLSTVDINTSLSDNSPFFFVHELCEAVKVENPNVITGVTMLVFE